LYCEGQSLFVAERFFGWLPIFPKLTHMEVFIENEDDFLKVVLDLLRILPNLEVLALPKVISKSYTCQNSLLCSDQLLSIQNRFMGYTVESSYYKFDFIKKMLC